MSSLIEYDENTQLDPESRAPAGDPHDRGVQLNLLELAWRARWLILLTALLGVGTAWVLLQRVVPRYTSVSRLYIERNMPRLLESDLSLGKSASYLYTQAELIRSTPVLANALDAPGNANLETFRSTSNRVSLLRKKLDVQVGKNDDIINVMLELPSAEDAAQLVNSVVDAYISKYAEQRRTDTVEVLNILRNEKQRHDAELKQRLEELAEFRRQNAALAVQVGEENVISQRFAALAGELDRVELQLLDAKARHNRTKQMVETPSLRPFLLELASSRQTIAQDIRLESQLQLDLEKQIREVDLQVATLRATWGDGHPRVKILLETRANLEKRLTDQQEVVEERKVAVVSAYVETVAQEYQLLEQKRTELQRNYETQFKLAMQVNSQAAKLTTLENVVARTLRMVDILDTRIKEVNLTEDVGAMNVSIMEVAGASSQPSYPDRALFLATGVFLGSLVGFGLSWIRDLMDSRLKSVDEIAATLQLPVLGTLTQASGQEGRVLTGKILLTSPRSVASEAFRTLRTSIHFGLTRDEAKVITITSPSPGDGKSTVVSNLAIAMAQADQRVLLIDADLRKPRQHEIFELEVGHGLSSVLADRRPVADVISKTEVGSLDVLPSGFVPANPVELLNNGYFGELLKELQAKYDKILIDSPPVMPVADARVIAAQSDATILVLRAERSTRRISLAARDELWKVRAQRLGVVVNAVPGRMQGSYGYGGYGGYGSYGSYGSYGYGYGNYGDVAYGEDDQQINNGQPKESRAMTAPQEVAPTESIEPVKP